jgi:lipoprotein-releasing system permease protein
MRGRGTANAVPTLSRISMAAIGVGAGALIVLFSVFNGFDHLLRDLYRAFYSDVRITPATGKFFTPTDAQLKTLRKTAGVQTIAPVLEEQVLASSEGEDATVVTLRGVDEKYFAVSTLKDHVLKPGTAELLTTPQPTALVGLEVATRLGISSENVFSRLALHYPNPDGSALDPASSARSLILTPTGIFAVDAESDARYVLAALPLVQELVGESGISSLEIKTVPGEEDHVRDQLKTALGKDYVVETRYEQNRSLNLIMQSEKWTVYAILVMVLLIASFNLVGALSMLVLQKKRDVSILRAMGADTATIRAVFLMEGVLWALVGGVVGVVLGALLSLGQQHFGWIKLQGQFIIPSYPVAFEASDFVVVLLTVAALGALAAAYPAWKAGSIATGAREEGRLL